MDIQYFFKVLRRRIWLILSVVVAAAIATYILVGKLPDNFKTNAILSTGIIEDQGFDLDNTSVFMQEFVTKTKFSNLIENMKNRSSIRLLTHRLLEHDLSAQEAEPFRMLTSLEEPEKLESISPDLLNDFQRDLDSIDPNTSLQSQDNQDFNRLFKTVSKAMEYDYESIVENLNISRIGETDYLKVEFISESPELSYYTVNTFCQEILNRFKLAQNTEKNTALSFYENLKNEKKIEFDSLTRVFNKYKAENEMVDPDGSGKNILGHLKELELRREQLNKEVKGLEKNIKNLSYNIKRTSRETSSGISNNVILNNKLEENRIRTRALQDKYDPSNPNHDVIKNQISKLVVERNNLIEKYAGKIDKDVDELQKENQRLRKEKLDKELELERAIAGVESLDDEIASKRGDSRVIVKDEANLGVISQKLAVAQDEYQDAVYKYNKAQLETSKPNATSQLAIIEAAQMPEKPESKNRAVMSAFAGVASGVLATIALFLLSYFDSTVGSPYRFSQTYNLPLTGHLHRLAKKHMDLNQIFNGTLAGKAIDNFRESLRKIRYAVETSGANTILVTSNKEDEGKTFFLLSLAYSLSLGNRKVLIIDSNFRNNSLTKYATLPSTEIPFAQSAIPSQPKKVKTRPWTQISQLPVHPGYLPNNVDILGNYGGNMSPSEALAGKDFVRILYDYQAKYDYILLEGSALNQFSDSRELAGYADKIIGVFAAQSNKTIEDDESVAFLQSLGQKYLGSVLNRVDRIE